MKIFWMKNRILLLTMAVVLALGASFWGALHMLQGERMQDTFITTSAAEAAIAASQVSGQSGEEGIIREASYTPIPPENAENLRREIVEQEWRYQSVIPMIDNTRPYDYKDWKQGDPVDEALADGAKQAALFFMDRALGCKIEDGGITVTRYIDEAGYRENILRLTNEKQEFICVLTEKDLTPVAADTILYSATVYAPDPRSDGEEAAKALYTRVTGTPYIRHASSGMVKQETYIVALSDGRYLSLAYTDNGLHGIKVHPNEYAMDESVCFLSDIHRNTKVVKLVAEASFEPTDLNDVGEGDMSPAEAERLYLFFLSAANGRAIERRQTENKTLEELDYNLKDGELTYFTDKTGYRENYYHIENQFISMDIAAKSGFIVRASCSGLYNPDSDLDLRSIPYEHMGEKEYSNYIKTIIEKTFGKDSYTSIDVNATYDDIACTMDAEMKDGSWYEFGFTNGRLMYVEYYAFPASDWPGWAADNLYINTLTGEEFYLK